MYYISLFEGSGRFILSLPRSIEDRFHTVFHRVVNLLGVRFCCISYCSFGSFPVKYLRSEVLLVAVRLVYLGIIIN